MSRTDTRGLKIWTQTEPAVGAGTGAGTNWPGEAGTRTETRTGPAVGAVLRNQTRT